MAEQKQVGDSSVKDFSGMIGISSKFAVLNRLITRDLNNNTTTPTFSLYSKEDVQGYLANPYTYEKQIRNAVTYIYGASSHFRRIIQYFSSLSDLAYVVSPYKIDPKSSNAKTINRNYRKVLNALSAMSIKTQFPKILTVCLREDTFYGTMWVTNDNITIQQLPSDYCAISTIEGNVLNVSFDFSYFDSHSALLEFYPQEFKTKYVLHEQWCIIEDGTKYLTGEYEDRDFFVTRGDSRIAMTIARNNDTVNFARNYRFLIDDPESSEMNAYLLTKPLKVGKTYNGHGVYSFVLQEVVSTDNDNFELGIADYYLHFPKDKTLETGNDNGKNDGSESDTGKKVWL